MSRDFSQKRIYGPFFPQSDAGVNLPAAAFEPLPDSESGIRRAAFLDERDQALGGGGSGVVERDAGWSAFIAVTPNETPRA